MAFDNGTQITGTIDDLFLDDAPIDTELSFVTNGMAGGFFATVPNIDIESCLPACPSISSGKIDGSFFGPNAEEVGGTLTLSGALPVDSAAADPEFVDFSTIAVWAAKQ